MFFLRASISQLLCPTATVLFPTVKICIKNNAERIYLTRERIALLLTGYVQKIGLYNEITIEKDGACAMLRYGLSSRQG